jgi:hypothetical protein
VEGEVLIEEIAEDAAKEIVAEGADPIAAAKDIVEHEHDGRTKQGVDDTYHHEGQE